MSQEEPQDDCQPADDRPHNMVCKWQPDIWLSVPTNKVDEIRDLPLLIQISQGANPYDTEIMANISISFQILMQVVTTGHKFQSEIDQGKTWLKNSLLSPKNTWSGTNLNETEQRIELVKTLTNVLSDMLNRDKILETSAEMPNDTKYEEEFTDKPDPSKMEDIVDMTQHFCVHSAHQQITVQMLHHAGTPSLPSHPQHVNGLHWDNFSRETMRRASFDSFPDSVRKSADAFLDSGFVYIGEGDGDKVICYYCHATKEGWSSEDDVFEIHRQLSPNCPIVLSLSTNNQANTTYNPPQRLPHQTRMMYAHRSENRPRSSRISSSEIVADSAGTTETQQTQTLTQRTPASRVPNTVTDSSLPTTSNQPEAAPVPPHEMPEISQSTNQQTGTSGSGSTSVTYNDLNITVSKAKQPRLATIQSRLDTFNSGSWPQDHHMDVNQMARAGLFFAGYSDCARCFYCGGGMRNWEDGDNAFIEHARWFPKCGFITQYSGKAFVNAVKSLSEDKFISIDKVKDILESQGETLPGVIQPEEYRKSLERDPAVEAVISEGFDKHKVLDVAIRMTDNGVSLSADGILFRLQAMLEEEDSAAVAGAAAAAAEVSDITEDINVREMREQNLELRKDMLCKICMDKEVGMVFLPCGHFITCMDCAWAFTQCPLCRVNIRGKVKAKFNR